MNPAPLRSAIVTGLAARAAWDGVDLFRYPAGDFAEIPSGFELGPIRSTVDEEDITLAGDTHEISYQIEGMLWVTDVDSGDADFAAAESGSIALINDLRAWIKSVNHRPVIAGGEIAYLELVSWEQSLTAEPGSAIEFVLAAVEYV